MESTYNGRASIYENYNGITITIPSVKNWFLIVFIGFILSVWSLGILIAMISAIINGGIPAFAVLLMFCFWLAFMTIPLRVFLWTVMGKEIISFENDVLTIDKKWLLFYKAKSYDLNEAVNFRVQEDPLTGIMPFGMRPFGVFRMGNSGTIRFDYGFQTIKFADSLDEAEANYILETLKNKKLIK
jgi:hypothetical protein